MRFKILTFNIHKGLNFTRTKSVLRGVRDFLLETNADIVFLQEVQGVHGQLSQTEYLAKEGWPYFFYGINRSNARGQYGNAILSKYPLGTTHNMDISATRFSHRGLLQTSTHMADTKMNLLCTHFGLFKHERMQQFKLINNFVTQKIPPTEPMILAGDFNDWRLHSKHLLAESLNLVEVFHEMHGKHAKTYPAKMPLLRVDRIYYRGLTPVHCEILKTKALSDHAPLLAEFTLPIN